MDNYWEGKNVVVTGCASFIGSHLCEELIRRGSHVVGIDDLSSGKLENLEGLMVDDIIHKNFVFVHGDLFRDSVRAGIYGDVLFHLAAVHGGRGYVDRQQALISTNFALDNLCFESARKAGMKKIVFASSGCVYPNYMQSNTEQSLYLNEDLVPSLTDKLEMLYFDLVKNNFCAGYDSDGIYGWAKLMAEFTLQAFHKAYGIETASCRYFTAYGPRAKEDHAVMAMIARAYSRQSPFDIWGDGKQIRNWTYIDDIVNGTLLVAEKVTDGKGVNVGTMERTSVYEAAVKICKIFNHLAPVNFLLDMPTGPLNRVASNVFIKDLGFDTFTLFDDGIQKTIDWYTANKTVKEAEDILKEGSLIDGRAR